MEQEEKKNNAALRALRDSIDKKLKALEVDSSAESGPFRALFDELRAYDDGLAEREQSVQRSLASLVEDMSETCQALTETGTRLDAVLEAAKDVAFIMITGDDNRMFEFSAGAEHIFGYAKKDVLGKSVGLLCPGEVVSKDLVPICPQGETSGVRGMMKRNSGEIFPVRHSSYQLKDSLGHVTARLLIIVDISMQEMAGRHLAEAHEKYKALALATPVSIMAFDSDGTVNFVNDWHMRRLDKSQVQPELYLGKKIYEIPGLVRAGVVESIKPVLQGRTVSLEDVYIPAFGKRAEAWQNIRTAPLMVKGVMRGGILIRDDVTRRKRTEQDLKLLIDSSPIPLLKVEVAGIERTIRYLNPEAMAMLGRGALNKSVDDYISVVETRGEGLAGMHGESCEVRTLNGVRRAIRTAHKPSGRFEVQAVVDVSVLMRAKEMAEEASRAKSDFLANISHEIRTPLNVLLGMLQIFDEMDLDDEAKEMLGHALGAANSLLALLNDILDFSVVEARALALDEHEFNPLEVVEMVAKPYKVEALKKGVDFSWNVDSTMPLRVFGDARRLRQVVFHLVGNAVKFTDEGNIFLDVHYLEKNASHASPRLLILVSDTGIGISRNQLDRIFEPFRQADGSRTRRHGGTGIGLALAHEFVVAMGGHIEVFAEPDVGTEAFFSIPVEGMRQESLS